ncbi:PrpF protein-domain-containing protein [Cadophora sp. MPI-SDFR-AT-0126]|nr:PrpF protein-domain-containing protein [Leotiomycetes sp. MPI-SDFR-AT-0126]
MLNENRFPTRHALPSVMMRSGTSKGLFIHKEHLPRDHSKWGQVLISVMGSQQGDQKQLDGVGGGTSTTSKVAIVSKSSRPDADVDYTFAQIAVGKGQVDFSGNCGNMACGVGPFALDEGLVQPLPGQTSIDVRVFNTNTKRLLVETMEVGFDGRFNEFGHFRIGGVKSEGSEIKVAFVDPAGSMTRKLLPTGNAQDIVTVSSLPALGQFSVRASLVDAANPFVFLDASTLPSVYHLLGPDAPETLEVIEAIRQEAAVLYCLAKSTAEASQVRGTPKIAVLSSSPDSSAEVRTINVQSFSMGKPHPSLQLTGGVCLGAALCTEGTIANQFAGEFDRMTPPGTPPNELQAVDLVTGKGASESVIRIKHRSGEMDVLVQTKSNGSGGSEIEKVSISRTARRLFEGNVYYSTEDLK